MTLLEEIAGTATCNVAGRVNTNPSRGEWSIPALIIRPHEPQETSVFVLTDDGLMQGMDVFEGPVTLGGYLGQIATSWSLAPTEPDAAESWLGAPHGGRDAD